MKMNDTHTLWTDINFTLIYGQKGKNINNGVFIKRVTYGGENEFYGVITHIYELLHDYFDSKNNFLLFYSDCYDQSARGTKIGIKNNTIEI